MQFTAGAKRSEARSTVGTEAEIYGTGSRNLAICQNPREMNAEEARKLSYPGTGSHGPKHRCESSMRPSSLWLATCVRWK